MAIEDTTIAGGEGHISFGIFLVGLESRSFCDRLDGEESGHVPSLCLNLTTQVGSYLLGDRILIGILQMQHSDDIMAEVLLDLCAGKVVEIT